MRTSRGEEFAAIYARARRFPNRVRRFDSCRASLKSLHILRLLRRRRTGAALPRTPASPTRAGRTLLSVELAQVAAAADIPVQFFQSTIAIELAVAGALLWQIRFFERGDAAARDREQLPHPRLQLSLALVLGATLFGSLWAIADEGDALAATLVTTGVAVSLLPLLVRLLPTLARDARTSKRDPDYAVTVVGLFVYTVVVGGVIALINID
jgi:hypothetical protein